MTQRADLGEVAEQVGVVRGRQLPRYPAYMPTGVDWLDVVPDHWSIRRLKWSVKACQNGIWGEEPDGQNDIVCIRVADFDRTSFRVSTFRPTYRAVALGERKGRVLRLGDLLLEKSGGGELQPVGAVVQYVHALEAVCSNFVARMPVASGYESRYLTYLHAHLYAGRVNVRSIKQTTGIQNLDSRFYLSECAVFPPLEEQQAIAAFLDRETAEIDGLIAKKRRLIELLKEKRTALISHAVTKGLNPKAPMKPSGIDWLGDVPAHWRLLRLRFIATIQSGLTLGKKYDPGTTISHPYLRVANVQDGYLDLTEITQVEIPPGDVQRFDLQAGDVLMTEGGDFDKLGRGYVWEGQIAGCLHQNHIFAVRPHAKHLDSHFLACVLTSSHGKNYFTSTSQQTTNLATTNRTKLGNLCVPLPDVEEQRAILAWIRARTHTIDNIVKTGEGAIVKLNEYRSALISAAVTGKIDVRGET